MKKIYSFLVLTLLAVTSAMAIELPYTADPPTGDPSDELDYSKWMRKATKGAEWKQTFSPNTVYDGNQWFGITASGLTTSVDSWLATPQFWCDENTAYKITFYIKKQVDANTLSNLDVYLAMYSPINKAADIIAEYTGYEKAVDLSDVSTTFVEKSITIATDPGESGNMSFCFRAHGTQSGSFICLAGFKIEKVEATVDPDPEPEPDPEPGDHVCAGLQVPYSSTIAESGTKFEDGWKMKNYNDDTRTWQPKSQSSEPKLYIQYTYSDENAANDAMVSPKIHLEAGKEYLVSYKLKAHSASYTENFTLYCSTSADTEAEMKAGTVVDQHLNFGTTTWTSFEKSFSPATTGDYHFCFYAHSNKAQWNLYAADFSIVSMEFAPAGVSNFTATADPEMAVKVALSWVLPTKSVFGAPFTADQTVEKVEIYRDGGETPIATLGGEATSFEDTEATGLTSGKHKYAIVVTVAGTQSAKVESNETKYVGPIEPFAIPAEFANDNADDFNTFYTIVHGANSTVDYPSTAYGWIYENYYTRIAFNSGTNKVEEDVLFFPPVAVTEPGYYRVSMSCMVSNSYPYTYKYVVANTPRIDAMTVVGEAKNIEAGYTTQYFDFYAAEAGTYYPGIFANNPAQPDANKLYIQKISVTASKLIPDAVTELTATADADAALSLTASWVNPTKSFAGTTLNKNEYKIEVYLGTELYKTLTGTEIADGTQTLTIPVSEAGVYKVSVKTVGLDGGALDQIPSATTMWVGPVPFHDCTAEKFAPYSSTIAVAANQWDEGWTSFNAGTGKEWVATSGNELTGSSSVYAKYSYHSQNPANTFLCSPSIHLEAGQEYVVMYGFKVYNKNNPENVSVYASTSVANADDITSGIVIQQHLEYTNTDYTAYRIKFTPALTGDYHFSFHAHSDANKYYIYLGNFSVVANEFAPASVSNFTATAAPARELKVSLAWTLPTKSVFDEPLTEEQTIESVEIYRDGGETPIATLAGDATSFEDTEATGLTSGKHIYKAVVTVAGVKSPEATSNTTTYVGPVAPTPLPATFTVSSAQDLTDLYTILKGTTSTVLTTAGWSYSNNQIQFNPGYDKREDDMMIFPPVAVETPGYYRVTLNTYTTYPEYGYTYKYVVGKTPTMEGMTTVGVAEGLTKSYAEHYFDFYAEEAGTYYVGVYANEQIRKNVTTLYINKIQIVESKLIPAAVSDLAATENPNCELNFTLSWTNPTTSFAGTAITKDDYKVEVYLGEELYTTLEGDALVEGTQTLEVTVPAAGLYTVSVKTVSADGDSAPNTPSLTTAWVGPKEVQLPYSVAFGTATDPTISFWEAVNGNNDNYTWTLSTGNGWYAVNGSTKDENDLYTYDDYLLSPAMQLTAGSTYRVSYTLRGGQGLNKFFYNMGVVPAASFDANKETWTNSKSYNVNTNGSTTKANETYIFTVPEDGKYKIVFAADEKFINQISAVWAQLTVYNVAIEEIFALPEIATDVTVTPDAEYALEATISWVNPAKDSFGDDIAGDGLTKAVIYRGITKYDIKQIAEVNENLIPGAMSQFVDYTLEKAGEYVYKVEIYNENGCSETAATEVQSTWIGGGDQVGAAGLNFGADWEELVFGTWTYTKASGAGNFDTSSSGLSTTCNNSVPDAWAVTKRPIQFDANTLYEIKVDSRHQSSSSAVATYDLYLGQGSDYTAYGKVGEWTIPTTAVNNATMVTHTFYVYGMKPSQMISLMSDEEDEVDPDPNDPNEHPLVAIAYKTGAGPLKMAVRPTSKGATYVRNITLKTQRVFTGLDELEAAANGVIFDGSAITFNGKASVHVYNMTGALVVAEQKATDSVSLENLADGAYIVTVVPENGKAVSFKVVK